MEQYEEIKKMIDNFYEKVAKGEEDWLENVTYVESITFMPENARSVFQENEVFVIERMQEVIQDGPIARFENENQISDQEKSQNTVRELYIAYGTKYLKMATIENGNIQFTPEYLEYVKNISPIVYDTIIKQNGKPFDIVREELQINQEKGEKQNRDDYTGIIVSLGKEELQKRNIEFLQDQKKQSQIWQELDEQEEYKPSNDEQTKQMIAAKTGISPNELSACVTIDPKTMISDVESFEDVTNTKGKYTKCFVTHANSISKGTSRFAFWGVTPDGRVEQIEGLEERDGVNTGKEVYAMNYDGSEVKVKQTNALFMSEDRETGFSVTVGQYGELETEYVRKDPTQNRYLATQIETSNQYAWTRREVLEQNNEAKTNKDDLTETLDNVEHQVGSTNSVLDNKEGVATETNLASIDTNPNTNKAINVDTVIRLHDDTETTLAKEAQNLGMSLEDYKREYEQTKGDCPAAKVEIIRINEKEKDMERKREERETPEDEYWRKQKELEEREKMRKAMES